MGVWKRWLMVGLAALSLAGCNPGGEAEGPRLGSLRVGIAPDQGIEEIQYHFIHLLNYLSGELGIPYHLTVPATHLQLEEQWQAGRLDLVYLGGLSFLRLHRENGLLPLVMRDEDLEVTSLFIAGAGVPGTTLGDFRDKRLAFGARRSSAGHLMPRFFLSQMNGHDQVTDPESFFSSVVYSGRHDLTAYWVRDGMVDLGVASGAVIRDLLADGKLNPREVRLVWESASFPGSLWAVGGHLSPRERHRLLAAFLRLSPDNAEHRTILDRVDTRGFVPVDVDDFALLERVGRSLEMLP